MENNDRDGNVSESKLAGDNVQVSEPSFSVSGSGGCEGEDNRVSYANTLRSRNKFVDALALYERVLENDSANVEAIIGKGICLQMQNMGKLAFDTFSEALRLDPQNASALTHCGILHKEEGRLVEAAESYQKALQVDPSSKAAAECLAIVLTDIGTIIKLAGNTQEGDSKIF